MLSVPYCVRHGKRDTTRVGRPPLEATKSHPRNQKRFHSRYNFGYGILLYMRKTADFCPFIAHFSDFEGIFSFISTKSAILCPTKTEVADFVSFKGSIVQGLVLTDKMDFQISFTGCSSIYPLVPIGSN